MPEPFISVIIPSYNYARFLVECVDSALAQTYPHREIIVVDDGSTDNTRQVLEHYGDKIVYIHQVNQGLAGRATPAFGRPRASSSRSWIPTTSGTHASSSCRFASC